MTIYISNAIFRIDFFRDLRHNFFANAIVENNTLQLHDELNETCTHMRARPSGSTFRVM